MQNNNNIKKIDYTELYKQLVNRLNELNLNEKIIINKSTFLKIFNEIGDSEVPEECFNKILKQLIGFKEFILLCPNCKNQLLETGHLAGHEASSIYLICFNCGKSFSYAIHHFRKLPELYELENPDWGEWRE